MEPPSVLRIKRKRGQDPLQALVLEDKQTVKRSKPSSPVSSGVATPLDEDKANFYFKLTRTDEFSGNDILVINSILNEAKTSKDKNEAYRNFILPKPQTQEDVEIPNELSDMVNKFMISDESGKAPRKRRHHSANHGDDGNNAVNQTSSKDSTSNDTVNYQQESKESQNDDQNGVDEYVYDVYQLSATAITTKNHPKSQIGYIKFFTDEDEEFNGSEDSYDRQLYSDNEDSNAEDYYQNDYPEDEDAEIDDDIHNDYKETELETEEINDLFDYVQQNNVSLVDSQYKSEDDADYVYGQNSDEDEDDEDYDIDDELDDYEYDNDNDFERQHFFNNESDDDLAIHRDKIFSKLQKMVDES